MPHTYITVFLAVAILGGAIFYAKNSIDTPRGNSPQQQMENLPLTGTKWVWFHTELPNGNNISTNNREQYVLSFGENSTMTSTTDCNTFTGSYTLDEEFISFSSLSSTKKFCGDSIELIYSKQLGSSLSYEIRGNRLYILLRRDEGTMVFEQQ